MKLAIAAIPLGCCPGAPRCALCPPAPPPPAPEVVAALAAATERDRPAAGPVRVGFYGGAPPSPALVAAAGGRPLHVRVRPDLLDRATARALVDAGTVHVELDALTLRDEALRAIGRPYRAARVLEQLDGLRALGVEVGIVLAPGLPDTSFETFLADCRAIVGRVDTVRLHPVLVLRGSRLRDAHRTGAYRPLSIAEAVTACRAALDLLEPGGVRVLRVGQQAVPDGLGHAVAGPRHPSLRELVEGRRALDALRALLEGASPGAEVEVRCAPADLSRARGPRGQHVRALRAEFALAGLRFRADPDLPRGRFALSQDPRCPSVAAP
jgi:hypothetical protein